MSQTKQRRWTKNIIFKHLEKNGFHPVDVQFGNGYFIFEHGKDMVVHFHVKELKGWKFGIWWNLDGDQEFDFFTQYERDIDKFKPTASTLVVENADTDDWDLKKLTRICRFIKRHPYRAWKLDQTWTSKIWEWGDLDDAFVEFYKAKWEEWRFNHVHERMRKRYLKLLNSICFICLENYEIVDGNIDGWVSSPRYDILCDGFTDEEVEGGRHYGMILEDEVEDWLMKKIRRYNKKMEKYEKRWWRFSDIALGEELLVTVRRKENQNDAKQPLRKNDKAVVPSRTKSKQSTGKKKSTGKVQQKTKASKSTKE